MKRGRGLAPSTRVGRAAATFVVALVALTVASASASASTFFVATGGNNANTCTSAGSPCLTIGGAVTKARAAPDVATINVAAGTYNEDVALDTASDQGTTIVGAGSGAGGTTIQGVSGNPTVTMGANSSDNALSHLHLLNAAGDGNDGLSVGDAATLTDVAIDMQGGGSGKGINASSDFRPLAFNGGSIAVTTGTGTGITGGIGTLALSGITVTMAGATSGAAIGGGIGPLSLSGSTINQSGTGVGINAALQSSLTNVTVTAGNASNASGMVQVAPATGAVLDHVSVTDMGTGSPLLVSGTATVRDSQFVVDAAATQPTAIFVDGQSAGHSASVQRSLFQQGNSTKPTLEVVSSDTTIDSSELLGGAQALLVVNSTGKQRNTTVISSTLDAGALGTRDSLPTSSIFATSSGSSSVVDVELKGSMALDSSTATVAGGSTSTINCSNSDVPNQTQAADATHGAINCANGTAGNVTTNPLTALFVNPASSPPDYNLVASSTAVDAVPESGVTLPAGVTASTTDFAGNPRVVDGNSDCVATRDRGALELTGHAGTVPAPTISAPASATAGVPASFSGAAPNEPTGTPLTFGWAFSDTATASGASVAHAFATPGPASAKLTVSAGGSCTASATQAINVLPAGPPPPGKISNLQVSPSNIVTASSGPTLLAAARFLGAVVSYSDSQAEKATFTVQLQSSGRRSGTSCVKATRRNLHRRRCQLYTNIGSFSRSDVAGPNKLHFSGRIKGRRLARGHYRLRGVPVSGGRSGAPAYQLFNVRR